jgi:hypothetical protein
MWRRLRVGLLLIVLAAVALNAWQTAERSTRWDRPLYVSIYPIAADDSAATRAYLAKLDAANFTDIDAFFARAASRYGLATDAPVKTRLQPELGVLPPPRPPDAGVLRTALWSLSLRLWAWRVGGHDHPPADIRMFVLYHDPARSPTVPHSLGLSKGLIGVVYAFALPAMSGTNEVVIAHELLHTLGATDKYDPADDAPLFPAGYGDPAQQPLFPQRYAEIMAGRRVLDPRHSEEPETLAEVVIGAATAGEVRMLRKQPTAAP